MTETVAVFLASDDPPTGVDKLYEVIDGRFVEPSPMGAFENRTAVVLFQAIARHVAEFGATGWLDFEMLFQLLKIPKRQLRPDLSFVSYERWPRDRPLPKRSAWDVVPDLAIEIVSPGNTAVEIFVKLNAYFTAGVRSVWVIYPRQGFAQVYHALDRLEVLGVDGTLDGGDIIPGLRIKLSDILTGGVTAAE